MHDLGAIEDAADLVGRAAVLHVWIVENVVQRSAAVVFADDVLGDELFCLRSCEEKRERAAQNVRNARHRCSVLFVYSVLVKVAKPAWRFAERVVEGRDDSGAAERIVIWIDRRPGAVWTVGRTVNPDLGPMRLDDGLEDDCVVSEDDGFDGRIRPFRRQELLEPLERHFFGRA